MLRRPYPIEIGAIESRRRRFLLRIGQRGPCQRQDDDAERNADNDVPLSHDVLPIPWRPIFRIKGNAQPAPHLYPPPKIFVADCR
jgi:hypothetical protein